MPEWWAQLGLIGRVSSANAAQGGKHWQKLQPWIGKRPPVGGRFFFSLIWALCKRDGAALCGEA